MLELLHFFFVIYLWSCIVCLSINWYYRNIVKDILLRYESNKRKDIMLMLVSCLPIVNIFATIETINIAWRDHD